MLSPQAPVATGQCRVDGDVQSVGAKSVLWFSIHERSIW
jgi:hypothetical protein